MQLKKTQYNRSNFFDSKYIQKCNFRTTQGKQLYLKCDLRA